MAIDTTVQPWIAKMLMPADGRVLGEAINNFAEGAAQGYLASKASTRAATIEAGDTPPPISGFERFVGLANPVQKRTVDETLTKDLSTIGQEIGQLKTSSEIFDWVKNNAALTASPIGHQVLSTIEDTGKRMAIIEAQSAQHIAGVELAKKNADLMVKYGLGKDATPEEVGNARAQDNEQTFTEHAARNLGKDISGLVAPDDFDTRGNWLPGAQQRILKLAPRSEFLQSREDLAKLREEYRTLMGHDFAPGPLEKDVTFIDKRVAAGLMTPEEGKESLRVREGLQAKASAAGDWMQRTEVQGLVKQKSKLMDAKVVAQNNLEDELAKGKRMFGGTSTSTVANLKRKVDQWDREIANINKDIDTFKPQAAAGRFSVAPVLPAGQTGSLMDTNVTRLQPQPALPNEDKVYIKTPDGKIGTIPKSKLDDALKRGATLFEG